VPERAYGALTAKGGSDLNGREAAAAAQASKRRPEASYVGLFSNQANNVEEQNMPLWKVYHPAGAFTATDKKDLSERIASVYAGVPIPKFYVVILFEEIAKDSYFVGGELHNKFIRFKIDQIARTIPGPIIREWWIRTLDQVIAPFVKDKGFDWEISIDETPFDLWSLQGELAPPFESIAEKRWVKENRASPYTLAEKLPVTLLLAPGVADHG
jgi:phenylpyruvate tautomerase PptA (4-oxalocrotonate tautomerase family)